MAKREDGKTIIRQYHISEIDILEMIRFSGSPAPYRLSVLQPLHLVLLGLGPDLW